MDSLQLAALMGNARGALHELSAIELPGDYRRIAQAGEALADLAECVETLGQQLYEWQTTAGRPGDTPAVQLGERLRKRREAARGPRPGEKPR